MLSKQAKLKHIISYTFKDRGKNQTEIINGASSNTCTKGVCIFHVRHQYNGKIIANKKSVDFFHHPMAVDFYHHNGMAPNKI